VSLVDFSATDIISNLGVISPGAGGDISVRNTPSGTVNVVIDTQGWYESPGSVSPCAADGCTRDILATSLTPTLSAATATTGTTPFQVWSVATAPALVASGNSATAAVGGVTQWTVSSGALQNAATYQSRYQVDGATWSPWIVFTTGLGATVNPDDLNMPSTPPEEKSLGDDPTNDTPAVVSTPVDENGPNRFAVAAAAGRTGVGVNPYGCVGSTAKPHYSSGKASVHAKTHRTLNVGRIAARTTLYRWRWYGVQKLDGPRWGIRNYANDSTEAVARRGCSETYTYEGDSYHEVDDGARRYTTYTFEKARFSC